MTNSEIHRESLSMNGLEDLKAMVEATVDRLSNSLKDIPTIEFPN